MNLRIAVPIVLGLLFALPAHAGEVFVSVPLESLELSPVEAEVADRAELGVGAFGRFPRVVLDGAGEAYVSRGVDARGRGWVWVREGSALVLRLPEAREATGLIFIPTRDDSRVEAQRFSVSAGTTGEEAPEAFQRAKIEYFEWLLRDGRPGAGWFRHQAREARIELETIEGVEPEDEGEAPRGVQPLRRRHDIEDTYDLFSGGRAVSENLQLDRLLEAGEGTREIAVADIAGITTAAMDWAALVADKAPEIDPLAAWIPADQHGVFFPSFQALVDVIDEASAYGLPVVQLMEPRSENALTRERTERQLCIELDAVARTLGPAVVTSVALTGSDTYLRTGSDVALLFECSAPDMLFGFLAARIIAAREAHRDTAMISAQVGGWTMESAQTVDRKISAFLVREGDVVLLSNSLEQVARLMQTGKGELESLKGSDEYRFFRDRYPRGKAGESAFLILTDATIRRWCGPRWRIAAARRTRAAAILAELGARHLEDRAAGLAPSLPADFAAKDLGELRLEADGVRSEVYGTYGFLTPIAELEVEKVSESERDAYNRFRNLYQRNWQQFFDPIAARLALTPEAAELDVTVMPLVLGTDYRFLVQTTRGATLAPDAVDPHATAILHYALAVNSESQFFRSTTSMAGAFVQGLDADPLGWVGSAVGFYAERDPFWKEWSDAEEPDEFIEENLDRLPIALHVDVDDALRLAGFLTAIRAFSNQAAPNMVVWENREHAGRGYVRVAPAPDFAQQQRELEDLALYYVPQPGSLVLSLREDLIQKSIERSLARAAGEDVAGGSEPWLGESTAIRAREGILDVLTTLWEAGMRDELRQRSWSNLTILNEWRRLFPDSDPVQVHAELWGTRLLCTGGGTYVWNAQDRTMESTVYGHPERPIEGAGLPRALSGLTGGAFGVTFEEDPTGGESTGLRVRARLERKVW